MNTKALRQKVLDLAIHGKLVPQNPNDESATVLLEKIRAEKAEKIKKGELKADKKDSFIFVGSDKRHYEQFADGTVKDIEDEIPFEVPDGWAWTKAKCLYNIRSAIRIHQTDWQSSGIPFFRGRELVELCKTGKVHPEIYISEELYEQNKSKGGIPQKNDLLVSAVGTLGFVHIVEGTKKFYYKDAYILCFENKFNLNPKYTKLVIESDYTQKVIYGGSKGTTVDQLTIENAKELWIPFPPLSEQEKIVSQVENIFLQVHNLEQDKSDLQTIIKQTKSKILDLAIHGKLVPQDPNDEPAEELLKRIATSDNRPYEKVYEEPFDIPDSWKWVKLNDLAEIARGGSPRPIQDYITEDKDGINWIKIGDTSEESKYITSAKEKIKPEGKRHSRFVHAGDFLLTNSMSFGRPYILKIDGCIHDGWLVFANIKECILQDYLYYALSSAYIYETFSNVAAGSTVKNLKSDTVKQVTFPLPPLPEQQRIIEAIENMYEVLGQIQNNLI